MGWKYRHLPAAAFGASQGPQDTERVRCFWCERLHDGSHPLSVCPECAARFCIPRTPDAATPTVWAR